METIEKKLSANVSAMQKYLESDGKLPVEFLSSAGVFSIYCNNDGNIVIAGTATKITKDSFFVDMKNSDNFDEFILTITQGALLDPVASTDMTFDYIQEEEKQLTPEQINSNNLECMSRMNNPMHGETFIVAYGCELDIYNFRGVLSLGGVSTEYEIERFREDLKRPDMFGEILSSICNSIINNDNVKELQQIKFIQDSKQLCMALNKAFDA